jgi:hypothetical protein
MNEAINLSFSPILPIDSYMQTESYNIYYGTVCILNLLSSLWDLMAHRQSTSSLGNHYYYQWTRKSTVLYVYMESIFHLSLELWISMIKWVGKDTVPFPILLKAYELAIKKCISAQLQVINNPTQISLKIVSRYYYIVMDCNQLIETY